MIKKHVDLGDDFTSNVDGFFFDRSNVDLINTSHVM